jgi:hypothetical protein
MNDPADTSASTGNPQPDAGANPSHHQRRDYKPPRKGIRDLRLRKGLAAKPTAQNVNSRTTLRAVASKIDSFKLAGLRLSHCLSQNVTKRARWSSRRGPLLARAYSTIR